MNYKFHITLQHNSNNSVMDLTSRVNKLKTCSKFKVKLKEFYDMLRAILSSQQQ